MIKDLLQGKPFRHPLHPMLVHLPIGLFSLSLLLDLGTFLTSDSALDAALLRGAFYTMIFGLVGALLAAVPGLVDYTDIRADHPAKTTATWHMILNLLAVGSFGINIGLRVGEPAHAHTPALPLIISLAAVGIISFSGYLGGILVYDDGIAVGRHRRTTPAPRATLRFSSADARDGLIAVADAASLDDRETLCLDVDGQIITIARIEGGYYAFQEFCTHRFGPLSEGRFHGTNVMCPWHRSCFDVRDGRVTADPAKVDLKTWSVQVQDGKILLRVTPR